MIKDGRKIKNYHQGGFAVLLVTFFALIIMLSIAMSLGFIIFYRHQNSAKMVKSSQAYYAAEAGIEDALLRLKKTPQISNAGYGFNVDNAIVNVTIPDTIGVSKAIVSEADNFGIFKKIKTICSIDSSQSTSFYYGIQVGGGGLVMNNGSRVLGNVFSGGNISGGSGIIDNDAIVSGNGNSIKDVRVKGSAMVYSCLAPAIIDGNLTHVNGGTRTCTVNGSISSQPGEILQQPMPIPQDQIDDWKNKAAAIQTLNGNVVIGSNQSLGPVKINGNLTINTGVTINLAGTVYVTGTVSFQNNVTVKLDASYGTGGGVIISDDIITINNGDVFSGTGQSSSYIMVLSTSSSDLAIDVKNNAEGVVLYANNGGITIHNNVSITEATGYKVVLLNNAEVQYSAGIVNIYFSGGPGGGWKVSSWQEE